MTARRALVVDDSKSARAFLTRVLERYELAVDGVESAEQAIAYLTSQRPDVIFMDHLMPGMDGFQAVQAIKNNPRTATIPIMMYTSQEGELYLSQARALGAMGVLPKQIKHADVSKVLDQLHLLGAPKPEHELATIQVHELPRDTAPPPDTTIERRGPNRPKAPPLPPDLRLVLEGMLAHHMLDVRRFIVDSLESSADRVVGDVRLAMQDHAPPSAAAASAGARGGEWRLWLGVAGVAAALLFGLEWSRQRGAADTLAAQLTKTQQQLTESQQSLLSLQAADAAAAASATAPANEAGSAPADGTHGTSMLEPVPFGETPLAGARLEVISGLLSRLNAQGFHGVVQVRSIPGRFCTVTGPGGTPVLAGDALLYSRCESVGNPRDDNASASQRQSVAFANMVATARQNAGGKIEVQISAGNSDEIVTPYPPVSDTLTAGEWNRVAAANNRVEVHWQPAH
ncbi:MAG: response regulator [Steroidobacterales bacterium]